VTQPPKGEIQKAVRTLRACIRSVGICIGREHTLRSVLEEKGKAIPN